MPIMEIHTTENVVIKTLPVTFNVDGSITATVRKGLEDANGVFSELWQNQVHIPPEVVAAVMTQPTAPGVSMYDTLQAALFDYINNNVVHGEVVTE